MKIKLTKSEISILQSVLEEKSKGADIEYSDDANLIIDNLEEKFASIMSLIKIIDGKKS